MVEMQVAGIGLDAANRSPIVLLRDPSGRRQVPIWIDQAQAQNILAGLDGRRPARPLSHDLMADLIEAGGLKLERVIIHAIEDNTFRAVLKLLNAGGESLELDARPSDAIALALRCGSGIWMLEEVVGDASIPVDAEADAEEKADFRRFLERTSPAELIRHLSKSSGAVVTGEGEETGGPEGSTPGLEEQSEEPLKPPSQEEKGIPGPTPPEEEPAEGSPGAGDPNLDD